MVDVIGDAIAVAIVAFAISVSMAQLFAKRHNYECDSNQVQCIDLSTPTYDIHCTQSTLVYIHCLYALFTYIAYSLWLFLSME